MDPSAYPDSWLFPIEGRWLKQFLADADRARRRGMRPGVFAKIGDSNVLAFNAFYGLGCRPPVWGEQDGNGLGKVIERYRQIELPPGADVDFVHCPDAPDRRPWNSFTRVTAAAMMGIIAQHLATPPEEMDELPHWWREDPDRLPGESALETELRVTRPFYALIQIGTNGANYSRSPESTAESVIDLVERVRRLGSVPVVINIPPQLNHPMVPTRWEFAEATARLIAEAAERARVPLLNLWLPLSGDGFVNHGLIEHDGVIFDGFHLDTFGGFDAPSALENSVDFRPEALRHGINYRNLLLLKMLEELDGLVGDAAGQ
jgi:hypothetical protein